MMEAQLNGIASHSPIAAGVQAVGAGAFAAAIVAQPTTSPAGGGNIHFQVDTSHPQLRPN